jgi:modification methylase
LQTEHRIFFQDARVLDSLADQSIDLVVTSPPYPMIEMWDAVFTEMAPAVGTKLNCGDGKGAFEAMHGQLDRVWQELYRVMKDGSVACINIGDATRTIEGCFQLYANHSRIQQKCFELGFNNLPMILWRKQTNAPNKFMGSGMLPGGAYVTLEHEYILILRKGGKRNFLNPSEKARRLHSSYFWEERNAWFSDLWDFKGARQDLKNSGLRGRSAAYPLELPFRLINMYSLIGDTVLDPFLGMATTTLAAMAAGRHSIGCEIDPRFSDAVTGRIEAERPGLALLNVERIRSHIDFVERYSIDKGELKHYNRFYKFPVMTGQERELRLPFLERVEKVNSNHFCAVYDDDQNIHENDSGQIMQRPYLVGDQGKQQTLF